MVPKDAQRSEYHKIFQGNISTTKNVDERFSFVPISVKLGSVYVSKDNKKIEKIFREEEIFKANLVAINYSTLFLGFLLECAETYGKKSSKSE